MLIQKLEIISFGKLSNIVLELTKGLNVVYGDNEAGKTTTTSFIKFMLFGFPKQRVSTNIPLTQKEKFIPWNNSNISGKLYCEYNNIDIVIERDYKKGDSASKTRVYTKATGEDLNEFKGVEPGTIFYNISLETFENTAFLLQNQLQTTSTDEMEVKLRNIATTGDDGTSYQKAKKAIEDEIRLIENSKAGQIRDLQSKTNELERELANSKTSQTEILSIEKELIITIEKLEYEQEELEKLKQQKQKQTAFLANSKLTEIDEKQHELDCLKEKAKVVKKIITEKDITEKNLNTVKEDIINYQIISAEGDVKADERKHLIAELKIETEKLKKHSKITENQVAITQKLKQLAGPLKYAILIAIVLATFITAPFLIYIPMPLGIIGIIMIFVNLQKGFKKKELEEIGVKSVSELKKSLEEIAVLTKNIGSINAKISEISPHAEKGDKAIDKIVDYLKINRFSVENVNNVIKVYENTLNEYKKIQSDIEKVQANISGLVSGVSVDELREKATENFENIEISPQKLEEMMNIKANLVSKLKLDKQRIQQSFEYKNARNTPPDEILEKQKDNNLKLEERLDRQKSLQIANKMLETAYNTMQMVFAPELSKKAEKYFESFTNDVSRKLFFAKDDKVSVNADNKNYMIDYFSTGTTDAIYIALRMAVCDIIYDKNHPILVFDDTFTHFDNERLSMSVNSINIIENDYQILYFTCKKDELKLFKNTNIINI